MATRLPPLHLHSLAEQLLHRSTTPFAIALGLGVTASSYFTFGNLSHLRWGVVKASYDEGLRKQFLTAKEATQLFAWHYEAAAPHMFGASVVGALSYFAASYLYKPVATAPSLRPLLIAGGLFSLFPGPWTFGIMMPINKRLLKLRDVLSNGTKPTLTPQEEEEVWQDISKWKSLHRFRIAAGLTAWLSGLAAVLLA